MTQLTTCRGGEELLTTVAPGSPTAVIGRNHRARDSDHHVASSDRHPWPLPRSHWRPQCGRGHHRAERGADRRSRHRLRADAPRPMAPHDPRPRAPVLDRGRGRVGGRRGVGHQRPDPAARRRQVGGSELRATADHGQPALRLALRGRRHRVERAPPGRRPSHRSATATGMPSRTPIISWSNSPGAPTSRRRPRRRPG